MKAYERWRSPHMRQEIGLARWGHFGVPVLVFPTAGGDAEEIERHQVVDACSGLVESGRVKLYSCDSVAGKAMVAKDGPVEYRMWLLNRFFDAVRNEVIPAIWADSGEQPIVVAGASIGAFNSVATLCRYPDVVRAAVAMSGSFNVDQFYGGAWSEDLYFSAPMQFVGGLGGDHLAALRQRFAILATGSGAWEDPGESWRLASVLGGQGIPNRVDDWGPEWEHDWHTWRAMLPRYLDELVA